MKILGQFLLFPPVFFPPDLLLMRWSGPDCRSFCCFPLSVLLRCASDQEGGQTVDERGRKLRLPAAVVLYFSSLFLFCQQFCCYFFSFIFLVSLCLFCRFAVLASVQMHTHVHTDTETHTHTQT